MEIVYRRYALLWNSKGVFYNKILMEELKDQIINKNDEIKLYNCMPFYDNEILETLLKYKKEDEEYINDFIYMYTCREDLLTEEFLKKQTKEV